MHILHYFLAGYVVITAVTLGVLWMKNVDLMGNFICRAIPCGLAVWLFLGLFWMSGAALILSAMHFVLIMAYLMTMDSKKSEPDWSGGPGC